MAAHANHALCNASPGGRQIEINLKTTDPVYKHRLRPGLNLWCVAAVLGLVGTWFSGTTVHFAGNLMNHHLDISVSFLTGLITVLWMGIVVWWYKDRAARTSKYTAAADKHPDVLCLDEFGVSWGVADVATTRIAWSAVAYFRLSSSRLVLGVPAGSIEVATDEFEPEFDLQELTAFLESNGVRNAS